MDIEVILYSGNTVEIDIYYKDTNAHDYFSYNCAKHCKDNLKNHAKRIIVFVSNDEKVFRLKEFEKWLNDCNYPDSAINQSFYKAKLQGTNIQSRHISEVFKNKNAILSQKQPKNLLRLLARAKFSIEINAFGQQNGFFKCIDIVCSLYIVQGDSFIMSNNMRWELRSRFTCRLINIIYYLKCNKM